MSGILNAVLTSFIGATGGPVGLLSLYTNPAATAVGTGKPRIRNDVMFMTFGTSNAGGTGLQVTSRIPLDLVGFTWQNQLNNGTESFGVADAVIDSGNNLIVVGFMNTPSVPSNTFRTWIAKINSSGVLQWTRAVNAGNFGSFFSAVDVDNSNNIYAVGFETFFNSNGDAYMSRFDPSGTVVYQRYFGDTTSAVFDRATGIAVINQGTAPADIFLINGFFGQGFQFVDNLLFVGSLTSGDRRAGLSFRDTGGNTRQTTGPCIRGEIDTVAYFAVMSYAGPSSTTNENSIIVKVQVDPVTYGISVLGTVALTLAGTTTTTTVVDMVMNPARTHFYVVCNLSDNTFVVAKYSTSMSLTWERRLTSTGVRLAAGGITVDSFDNFYVSFQTQGTPFSGNILKMPGSGAGIGSTAVIGGRTYTYTASTLNTFISLISFSYTRTPVTQATTPTTPTPTNTAGTLASSVVNVG